MSSAFFAARALRAASLRVAALRARFVALAAKVAAEASARRALAEQLVHMMQQQQKQQHQQQQQQQEPVASSDLALPAGAAERVRALWSAIGRAAATPPLPVSSSSSSSVGLSPSPASSVRSYAALASAARRISSSSSSLWTASSALSQERAARLASLQRLESRLRARLDALSTSEHPRADSAARLAAAAARVAPAFDKTFGFSPRKKLVL